MGLLSGKKYLKRYSEAEVAELEAKVKSKNYDNKDFLAMFLAALWTFLPPLLIFLGAIGLLVWLFS